MKTFAKLAVVSSIVGIFLLACSQASNTSNVANKSSNVNSGNQNSAASPSPAAADQASVGKELYGKHCAVCHKENGSGGKVTVEGKTMEPESLISEKMKKRSDEKITRDITDGVPDEGMPAFKDKLKPEEIASVIKHVRSLQPQ